jgi:CRP/FNR family transcriptional regulator, cyclic AMP receptor protein
MWWIEYLGYAASAAVLASFCMSTMRPLRALALGSNVLFAAYGFFGHLYPVLVLHAVLFPINLFRLVQIHRLIGKVRAASTNPISMETLLPYMQRRALHAGDTLFRIGDVSDHLYYIASGSLEVRELGVVYEAGDVVGEIGIFAPDRKRTATVICRTDCDLHALSESTAKQLYFQDPAFGFAVLRLITTRLVDDIRRHGGAHRTIL